MDNRDFPNMAVIKGLIATSIGFMFIFFAYSILLRMIMFSCGVMLVYYGLQQLNIPALNHIINTFKSYINRFLS